MPFPTLRFLRAASPVSRRLRHVQDWPLLLLRVAIVAVICAAAAGPTLVSGAREQAWRSRLHCIVVIDGAVAADAPAIAEARRAASSSSVLGPAPIAESMDEAIALAERRSREMRTEIVVAWDGSRDVLVPSDLEGVPATVGLRLLAIPGEPGASGLRSAQLVIDATTGDATARDRVTATVGATSTSVSGASIAVSWPGATAAAAATVEATPPELRRVLDEIADDPRVRDAAERSHRDPRAPARGADVPGRRLAQTADGVSLLRGWIAGQRVVLVLDAAPTSPLALWSVVAAQESLARPWNATARREQWTADAIAAAEREPTTPVDSSLPGGLDTRAAWSLALVLLAFEQWWRRRTVPRADAEVADAA